MNFQSRENLYVAEVSITVKIGSNEYKLLLLDTNAVHEIVQNYKNAAQGFFEIQSSEGYFPCISFHTLVELKPKKDIYDELVEFVRRVIIFLILPYKAVLDMEYDLYHNKREIILEDFAVPARVDILEQIFNENNGILKEVDKGLVEAESVVENWKNQRSDETFSFKEFKDFEDVIILKFLKAYNIANKDVYVDKILYFTLLPYFCCLSKCNFSNFITKLRIVA